MMERLTKTSEKGGLAFTFDLDVTCSPSDMRKIYDIGVKLKAYEDTGLTPEQVKAQKWISVKNRLPDKNQYVLGYFPVMSGTPSSMQITVGWNMNERSAIGGWGAAYWMPLPEPPKEAQE